MIQNLTVTDKCIESYWDKDVTFSERFWEGFPKKGATEIHLKI